MSMHVRIKPYNKKKNQLAQRVVMRGVRFDVTRGWYEVDDEFAAELALERLGGDPNNELIFDVVTAARALEIQREEEQAVERARAEKPIVPERVTPRVDRDTRSTVTTGDIARKSNTPIAADGADGDDETEDENDGEGRVAAVGRMGDDSGTPSTDAKAPAAPKSRRSR